MTRQRLLATLLALTAPGLAFAHPGHAHDAGFAAGLLHPFTGGDHLLGVAVAGLLLAGLPAATRWPMCAAFLAALGVTHALWLAPDTSGGAFIAGILFTSTVLVAAGMAATSLARFTAGAARSRIWAAGAAPVPRPSSRR